MKSFALREKWLTILKRARVIFIGELFLYTFKINVPLLVSKNDSERRWLDESASISKYC